MNTTDPIHAARRAGRRRWATLAPPLLLGVLAVLVAARTLGGGGEADPDRTADSRAHANESTELPFEPASVELPAGWRLSERSDGVATWRAPDGDDAVSVAAVEASATPLAAIVADVARRARTAGPDTEVAAPRALPGLTRARRDVVVELGMRTRVGGRDLFVRQVWRRDSRAGRDVVATWTSSDEAWEVDPAATVPTLDLR